MPDASPRPLMLLYDAFLAAAAAIFVVAAGLIGWSILRGRQRSEPHEDLRLELLWWAVPTALAIVLFLLTAGVLGAADEPDAMVTARCADIWRHRDG